MIILRLIYCIQPFNRKQYCQKQVHFCGNNKIEISFSNYIFGINFQNPSSKYISTKMYLLLTIFLTIKLYVHIDIFKIQPFILITELLFFFFKEL